GCRPIIQLVAVSVRADQVDAADAFIHLQAHTVVVALPAGDLRLNIAARNQGAGRVHRGKELPRGIRDGSIRGQGGQIVVLLSVDVGLLRPDVGQLNREVTPELAL